MNKNLVFVLFVFVLGLSSLACESAGGPDAGTVKSDVIAVATQAQDVSNQYGAFLIENSPQPTAQPTMPIIEAAAPVYVTTETMLCEEGQSVSGVTFMRIDESEMARFAINSYEQAALMQGQSYIWEPTYVIDFNGTCLNVKYTIVQ